MPFFSSDLLILLSFLIFPYSNSADLTFPSLKDSTLKNEERAFTAFVPTPLSPTDF